MQRNEDLIAETYKEAMFYKECRQYHLAVQRFTTIIDLDPNDANAYYNRGVAYSKQRAFTKAILDFTTAIKLNPQFAQAYSDRGFIYVIKGEEYRQKHTNELAIEYEAKGFFANAILDYALALELDPTYTMADKNLRDFLENIDKKIIYKEIRKLPPNDQIFLFKQCLNTKTRLGERFWKQEGFYECSLENGSLRKIKMRLEELSSASSASFFSVSSARIIKDQTYQQRKNQTFEITPIDHLKV